MPIEPAGHPAGRSLDYLPEVSCRTSGKAQDSGCSLPVTPCPRRFSLPRRVHWAWNSIVSDLSEFTLGLGWEPSLTPFYPYHELPFIRRMEIEGKTPTRMPSWVLPDRLVSYTADDPSTTLDGRSLQMRRYYLSHDAVRSSLPY